MPGIGTHREALKSFASFFKSCEVWSRAPRPEPAQPVEEKQRTGRTALVPGGHRSALTEPAGENAGDSPGSGLCGTQL